MDFFAEPHALETAISASQRSRYGQDMDRIVSHIPEYTTYSIQIYIYQSSLGIRLLNRVEITFFPFFLQILLTIHLLFGTHNLVTTVLGGIQVR